MSDWGSKERETMEFFVHRVLTVLFGNISLSDRIGVAQSLNKATEGLFDGEPTVLPIPGDAPSEIPRIMLGDKDNVCRCHISPRRIEFSLESKKGENKKLEEVQSNFLSHLSSTAGAVRGELRVKVERLGGCCGLCDVSEGASGGLLDKKVLEARSDQ
jgi:hypothetical protein